MVAQLDKAYRRLGATRTLRRVASWALFEGRPHTTRGQWANPAILTWLKTIKALPGQPAVDRPIFVVGLGRSGTTILGKILSAHEDVAFLNEPKAIWTLIDPATDICGDYVDSGGRFFLNASDASDEKKTIAHRLFGRYVSLLREKRLVDKYPELIFRLEFVSALFDDALFVFITRNGIDACQSISNWSTRKGAVADNIKWRYLCDELIRGNTRYRDLASLDLDSLPEVDRAAIEWLITTETGLEQLENRAANVALVRYEDLVADPDRAIAELNDHCGLRASDQMVTYAREVLTLSA